MGCGPSKAKILEKNEIILDEKEEAKMIKNNEIVKLSNNKSEDNTQSNSFNSETSNQDEEKDEIVKKKNENKNEIMTPLNPQKINKKSDLNLDGGNISLTRNSPTKQDIEKGNDSLPKVLTPEESRKVKQKKEAKQKDLQSKVVGTGGTVIYIYLKNVSIYMSSLTHSYRFPHSLQV